MLRSTFSRTLAGWSPAYAAALALVAIQVGIGIIYKIAQKGGRLLLPNDLGRKYRFCERPTNQCAATHSRHHPPSPYPNSSNAPFQHSFSTENAGGGTLRGVLRIKQHRLLRSDYQWKRRMIRGLSVRHRPWRKEETGARTMSRSRYRQVPQEDN